MAQINKLLPILMNYKGSVVTKKGFDFTSTSAGAGTGSIYSSGKNGTGTNAAGTTAPEVAKALMLMFGMELKDDTSAVCAYDNEKSGRAYAEVTTVFNGVEFTDVCVYTRRSGAVLCVTVNHATGALDKYEIDYNARKGAVILLAVLVAEYSYDQEVNALIDKIKSMTAGVNDFADLADPNAVMQEIARLSDNLYFRMKNGNIKLSIESAGGKSAVALLQKAGIDSGAYVPNGITFGQKAWEILSSTMGAKILINRNAFLSDYLLNPGRKLDKREKKLVPEVPEWYEIPQEAVIAARNVVKSSKKTRPQRNILLKGPAGTGKTQMAKAVSAALGLPYTHQTCDAGMELFNLVGTILPATNGVADMSTEELAARIDLPTVEDVYFDHKDAYFKITGETAPGGITQSEVITLLFEKQMDFIKSVCGKGTEGKDFVYVPSELIKAVKYGWVCEVQEPTVIIQPGVLPGLNSLLEGGSISLPTGEIVERHPDSVIVFTTNTDYEGCRPLNESVLDRFPMKFFIDLPDEATLIARATKVTGVTDSVLITSCLKVLDETRQYLIGQGCGVGNIGPRLLYDWIDAIDMGERPEDAAEYTLLASASDDEEIVAYIRENIISVAF